MNQSLAYHETADLHELLSFKSVCLTKAQTMQALVSDQALKSLLQQDVNKNATNIQELQGLLSRTVSMTTTTTTTTTTS